MKTRANAGKQAKTNGTNFESMIDYSCIFYRQQGIACIEKTPEPFRVTNRLRGGKFVGFFEKQAQVDFKGTLQGGQSILFEAKNTNEKRLPFDRVKEHQYKQLERESKLGAACYIFCSYQLNRFFFIPFSEWAKHKKFSKKKSMSLKDMEEFEVSSLGLKINFLENMEEIKND